MTAARTTVGPFEYLTESVGLIKDHIYARSEIVNTTRGYILMGVLMITHHNGTGDSTGEVGKLREYKRNRFEVTPKRCAAILLGLCFAAHTRNFRSRPSIYLENFR